MRAPQAHASPERIDLSLPMLTGVPSMLTGVHLWQIDLALRGDTSVLSPDEWARAARLVFPERRRQFIAARAGLRAILGEYTGIAPGALVFTYGEVGKPMLDTHITGVARTPHPQPLSIRQGETKASRRSPLSTWTGVGGEVDLCNNAGSNPRLTQIPGRLKPTLEEIKSSEVDSISDLAGGFNAPQEPSCSTSPYTARGWKGEVHFNLAHSGDLALVAVARQPVGVDLETVRVLDSIDAMAQIAFTPEEQAALAAVLPEQRTRAFFRAWTRKEALMKAHGGGFRLAKSFSLPLASFTRDAPLMAEIDGWQVCDVLIGEPFAAALAIRAAQPI